MHCWARYIFLLVVASLALGQMLPACGQKGPLYLPEPPPAAEAEPEPVPGPSSGEQADDTAADVPNVPSDAEMN